MTTSRVADRALAAVALLVTMPLLGLAAVGIKWSSPGPVIYRARRCGRFGTPFTMYKFRTMSHTQLSAARITGGTDPRVFPWGRVLRRWKIDELPQLLNIVRGEMAIVGPRPEDPSIVEREYAPWMRETLEVLPGLTSPGSLLYYAAERELPNDPELAERIYLEELLPWKLAADLVYVRRRSAGYDAMLIVRTLAGLFGIQRDFAGATRETVEAKRILAQVGSR